MNARTTLIILVVLALVVGLGYSYTRSRALKGPDQVNVPSSQFYLVDTSDIQGVEVDYRGQAQKFIKDKDNTWHFDTPLREPVNLDRWGGITLLVSGPRYDRIISQQATDLARYGLQDPALVVKANLATLGDIAIKVGDKTPDGRNAYALYQDERAVHLIAAEWGDVLARLVTEPPQVTPTPVEGTATPVQNQSP